MAKRVKSKEKYKIKNWHEYNNSLRILETIVAIGIIIVAVKWTREKKCHD
ncbi:hypothetical protein ACYULU_13135 [Breznakiellaceae bacterium SP9]